MRAAALARSEDSENLAGLLARPASARRTSQWPRRSNPRTWKRRFRRRRGLKASEPSVTPDNIGEADQNRHRGPAGNRPCAAIAAQQASLAQFQQDDFQELEGLAARAICPVRIGATPSLTPGWHGAQRVMPLCDNIRYPIQKFRNRRRQFRKVRGSLVNRKTAISGNQSKTPPCAKCCFWAVAQPPKSPSTVARAIEGNRVLYRARICGSRGR